MPGCLFYFCAEWQRARRVLQIDLDGVRDLVSALSSEGELMASSRLAQQYGIVGWKVDDKEASDAGLPLGQAGLLNLSMGGRSLKEGLGPVVARAGTEKALVPTPPPGPPPRAPSPMIGMRDQNSTDPDEGKFIGKAATMGSASAYHRRGPSPSAAAMSFLMRVKTQLGGNTHSSTADHPHLVCGASTLLFHNPGHPLSGLRSELSKDEFVQEMRSRMTCVRLFAGTNHNTDGSREPVFSVEEAEDLFEALLLMQQPRGGSTTLHMGRPLDNVVKDYFTLVHVRQFLERGASSLSAFFDLLDLDKNKFVEVSELKHFLKNATPEVLEGLAAALCAEGFDYAKMAEMVFQLLDINKDRKLEITELRKQVAVASPPRMSPVELLCHLELKYGLGKGGITYPMERATVFDAWAKTEWLDMSPEDVVTMFRAVAGDKPRMLQPGAIDAFFRHLPLDGTWGSEPHSCDIFFSALGCRALVLERARRQDLPMPSEAVLEVQGVPDDGELRSRFDRLWERCSGATRASGGHGVAQLREGCWNRFLASAREIQARREKDPKRVPTPRSIFPNIGDVLATSSSRLFTGQSFVVRYRLSGSSNYWHPEHTVLKDEHDALPWPVPRKVLGETPFIGLVPAGLRWTSAGGGGFYLGSQGFTTVDPHLRADLPRDPTSGAFPTFGYVELVAPSLTRKSRGVGSSMGLGQGYELRLFCSTKGRIVGCVGEPVPVHVVHQVRPPPMQSLQLRCDGRRAHLRWATLDLGPHAPKTSVDMVRLQMRGPHGEKLFQLPADVTEHELDLAADAEYEFRVRLENRMGVGREAYALCRTNAVCEAPAMVQCYAAGTTFADIRWSLPRRLGNETTRDKFQRSREAVECYEAVLKVEDDEKDERPDPDDAFFSVSGSSARKCRWKPGQWRDGNDSTVSVRISALRPDTRYAFDNLCAVNSMGVGVMAKKLVFWTIPQAPRIATVRVRGPSVLLAMSQHGGVNVKEYSLSVCLTSNKDSKANFTFSQTQLRMPQDGSGLYPELAVPFDVQPAAPAATETHTFQIRANNLGGWSEWSEVFDTTAVARQQGADQAQARLIQAIESRRIELLQGLLEEVRGIEFRDECYVVQATELLELLTAARHELTQAMHARDPESLKAVLQRARALQLPDLNKPETLLKKLETVVQRLQTAKGIEPLRVALRAGHEARLPQPYLSEAVERLQARQATQDGLEAAIKIARVPALEEALRSAVGMHLPSENKAKTLLGKLRDAEQSLRLAVRTAYIADIEASLEVVEKTGLREDALIEEANALVDKLRDRRTAAREKLDGQMSYRHPGKLREAITTAQGAQVPEKHLVEGQALLAHLEGLMDRNANMEGIQDRTEALETAREAGIPDELLETAEIQLECLVSLHKAVEIGFVEVLRRALKAAREAGVKSTECCEPQIAYNEWAEAYREVEVARALGQTERLTKALERAASVGLHRDQLKAAKQSLAKYEDRDQAKMKLRLAIARRKAEDIQKALENACEAEVVDTLMFEEAGLLVERLYTLRAELTEAVDLGELGRLHEACARAKTSPALPDKEVAAAEKQLHVLQGQEEEALGMELRMVENERDYRGWRSFLHRLERAKHSGINVDEAAFQLLAEDMTKKQHEDSSRFEQELQEERTTREYLPSGEVHLLDPEPQPIPIKSITSEWDIDFRHAGEQLTILPREIVETTISVPVLDEEAGLSIAEIEDSRGQLEDLVSALHQLLDSHDDLHRLDDEPQLFDDTGKERVLCEVAARECRLELGLALYVRAAHSGIEIVEALCRRDGLGVDIWEQGLQNAGTGDEAAKNLAMRLSSAITGSVAPLQRRKTLCPANFSRKAMRFSEYVLQPRARLLRRVAVELSWTYPRGLLDTLDPSCIAFSSDDLIEIIDHRGSHGPKYGCAARVRAPHIMQEIDKDKFKDNSCSAVRYEGDIVDQERRAGKQKMLLRLDFMPARIIDLIFVASTYNSSNLSKFAEISATLFDMDTTPPTPLTHHSVDPSVEMDEQAVVVLGLSKLADGLWHVHSHNEPCAGTTRNYRPIMSKLMEMGYPRTQFMRGQVQPIMRSIQTELGLETPVKPTGFEFGRYRTMKLNFAIEIFDESEQQQAFAKAALDTIDKPAFLRCVATGSMESDSAPTREFVCLSVVERYLRNLHVQLHWSYPGERLTPDRPKRQDIGMHVAFELDGSAVMFQGRALREVVDYRGPHGIRVVHNGVLDYSGVWVGKLNISDASAGSLAHVAEEMDDARQGGMQVLGVKLDRVPTSITELFFVLSAIRRCKVDECRDLRVHIVDAENNGHILATCQSPLDCRAECAALACLSTSCDGRWALERLGATRPAGNSRDYRPMLRCLRAIQEKRHPNLPQWPHRALLENNVAPLGARPARLPRLMEPIINEGSGLPGLFDAVSEVSSEDNRRASRISGQEPQDGGANEEAKHEPREPDPTVIISSALRKPNSSKRTWVPLRVTLRES